VTTREPEWRPEDLDLALAAHALDREPVGPHGHPLSESTSPDADPNNPKGTHFYRVAYDGEPIVDFAEGPRQRAIAAYKQKHPGADMSALMFIVERVDR
jgi:hypothetical protein